MGESKYRSTVRKLGQFSLRDTIKPTWWVMREKDGIPGDLGGKRGGS